jgi:hypothetical protein
MHIVVEERAGDLVEWLAAPSEYKKAERESRAVRQVTYQGSASHEDPLISSEPLTSGLSHSLVRSRSTTTVCDVHAP